MKSKPRATRAILAAALAVALLTPLGAASLDGRLTVGAAEGDPGDYCSQAPDLPLAWDFSDSCRGHDECIEALGRAARMAERLGCDAVFLEDLLEAQHPLAPVACGDHVFCRAIAGIYYHVVRYGAVVGGMFAGPPAGAEEPLR